MSDKLNESLAFLCGIFLGFTLGQNRAVKECDTFGYFEVGEVLYYCGRAEEKK